MFGDCTCVGMCAYFHQAHSHVFIPDMCFLFFLGGGGVGGWCGSSSRRGWGAAHHEMDLWKG